MKKLNIDQALELFRLIGEFVPNINKSTNYLDYSGIIIHNIRNSETPEVFGKSILLMYTKETAESLQRRDVSEIIQMFIRGLIKNDFLSLVQFCRDIGYGR